MADVKDLSKKAKPAPMMGGFEMPKFDMGNFATMDIPVAMREMAEKSVAQAKDAYEKLKVAAEETTELIEDTYVTAAKGAAELNLKTLEAARANVNAAFDYARDVMQVKTLSEAIELSSTHLRKQFDVLADQAKDLSTLAQKVATDTAEPVKGSVGKVLKVD